MKSHLLSIVGALSVLGVALAQTPQQTPPPQPSTSQTEGTAADRVRPGEAPTQGARRQAEDPRPATKETEGTAADRTPPGKTPTRQGDLAKRGAQSEIIGAAVVTSANAPIGKVVDVVFDATDQPAFVVIQSEGKAVAVPYAVANSMKTADKIVIDRSRLQAAPKVKEGQWRDESSRSWKKESEQYWDRG
jgi:sporulation protein YlmC with PRC-barrel domain